MRSKFAFAWGKIKLFHRSRSIYLGIPIAFSSRNHKWYATKKYVKISLMFNLRNSLMCVLSQKRKNFLENPQLFSIVKVVSQNCFVKLPVCILWRLTVISFTPHFEDIDLWQTFYQAFYLFWNSETSNITDTAKDRSIEDINTTEGKDLARVCAVQALFLVQNIDLYIKKMKHRSASKHKHLCVVDL